MTSRSRGINLHVLASRLQARIDKGAPLLWEMEQQHDTGDKYQRWVTEYAEIVRDFSVVTEHLIFSGEREIAA